MGSRRSESWGRYDKGRGYDSEGWESGDGQSERGRDRERRYDGRRGNSAEEYGRRGDNLRHVKYYEWGEVGHYKSQCPRLQVRQGSSGGTVTLSRDLEDSLNAMGRMAMQLLEQQKQAEDAKREAEARKAREEAAKAAKEEEAKAAMAKKLEKETKEKRHQWEIRKLLAEQAAEYEAKLEKMVGLTKKMKGVPIGKKKAKVGATPPSSSDESDEEVEDSATPLKDKRKRRDSTGAAENSPPVETPKKLGKMKGAETPASQKKKGRGRPTKAKSQVAWLAKGEDPWEGVPTGEKYATEAAFRKAVRKTIGAFYPETLKEMCRGAGLPFYGVNDAIDTLSELRVTYCYRHKKSARSTSTKSTDEEQIGGALADPEGEPEK
ncbi:hypothetical protein CBR_g46739 [Chara braunii]|uniref:Uncharacterized protein n=1 Tax=Chara braunii TaxID=69332 RepID=A0A388K4B4_CHABU|nr:hypothetical protein CBR_g46739 [Chara braunii]|eukprot:GBG64783.1 hypothetical protein CBR_g46739 [Chara braunii]